MAGEVPGDYRRHRRVTSAADQCGHHVTAADTEDVVGRHEQLRGSDASGIEITWEPLIKKGIRFIMVLFVILGALFIVLGGALLFKSSLIGALELFGIKITGPVGLVVLVLGLFVLAFPFTSFYKTSSGSVPSLHNESPLVVPPQMSISPRSPSAAATITSPVNFSEVGEQFTVTGTASGLGRDRLWLLLRAEYPEIGREALYRLSGSPINIDGDAWSVVVGPLGGQGNEIGMTFMLKLVEANPQCSNTITRVAPDSHGMYIMPTLPRGCEAVVTLYVKKVA